MRPANSHYIARMDTLLGAGVIERGIFDPRHANEAAIFAAWAGIVMIIYWKLAARHLSGI